MGHEVPRVLRRMMLWYALLHLEDQQSVKHVDEACVRHVHHSCSIFHFDQQSVKHVDEACLSDSDMSTTLQYCYGAWMINNMSQMWMKPFLTCLIERVGTDSVAYVAGRPGSCALAISAGEKLLAAGAKQGSPGSR